MNQTRERFVTEGVGNRLTKVVNYQIETYTYVTGTNRLQEITGPVSYTYDANGNITGIGNSVLTYNQNNRLIRVEENSNILGEYTYNGEGQRVIKTAGGVTTVFHYDFRGNIIGESDQDGDFHYEYLYKGGSRLALVNVASGEIYSFLNDRLGTPQMLADSTNTIVWEGIYKPFGEAEVNPNSSVVNNFRFPGQYYDAETGFHFNWHRYYDPSTGRYLRPDPIGLAGGINLFTYALSNPVINIDQFGLDVFGINTGGSYFRGAGGGASSALLIQSDGKTNRIGLVTTQDVGGGYGQGLFTHVVYGQPGNTIEGYANTVVSNSGSIGYASYSWSFGDQEKPFYEAGVSLIPGESVSLTKTTGQVIFALEYSFGAADNFYGEWLYDHRLKILNAVFGGIGEDIYDWLHSCE